MTEFVQLGDVIESAQSGFASGERAANGVVQLRMNNVTTDGNLDWSSFIRIPATEKEISKYSLVPGDVLFNATNSPNLVGKTAFFDGHAEKVVFSNHFVRLKADVLQLEARYLARWLTYQWQQKTFESLCTQWVNQATVRKEDLLLLKISLPPLPEQRHIAALLDRADRLRRTRRYAAQLSETFLQAVFMRMFGDPRTNLMRWDEVDLDELVTFISGKSFKFSEYVPQGVRLFQIANVSFQETDWDTIAYLPASYLEEYPQLVLSPGDLLMALNRPILGEKVKFAILSEKDCPAILYQRVGKIIIKSEKIIQAFLFGLMHTRYFYHELKKRLAGSDQPYINPTELVEMRVYTPPLALQQKFARIVQQFERLRAQQREAERQAEHLFQTLLHRAFEDK